MTLKNHYPKIGIRDIVRTSIIAKKELHGHE